MTIVAYCHAPCPTTPHLVAQHIPAPIQPPNRRQELLEWLEQDLQDLSVSRTRDQVPWGIAVPDDPRHTIYVWLDALTNYLTVTGYPNKDISKLPSLGTHVIGKDILK